MLMTKNRLKDLNDHLFAQIERLGEEDMTAEQIETEIRRTGAIVSVADAIISNGDLQLRATKLMAEHGVSVGSLMPQLPAPGREGGR
jgi:hypothetical protein